MREFWRQQRVLAHLLVAVALAVLVFAVLQAWALIVDRRDEARADRLRPDVEIIAGAFECSLLNDPYPVDGGALGLLDCGWDGRMGVTKADAVLRVYPSSEEAKKRTTALVEGPFSPLCFFDNGYQSVPLGWFFLGSNWSLETQVQEVAQTVSPHARQLCGVDPFTNDYPFSNN